MIFGIGTDICDVRRIRATFERQGERFVRKVLSEAEVKVWQQRTARSPERGIRFLATRFSAKEAFSKAVGLGMRMPMTWRRCEIANAPSGQPLIVLHGELQQWFEAQGLRAHVSVTDETEYAASYVVVERTAIALALASDDRATGAPSAGTPAKTLPVSAVLPVSGVSTPQPSAAVPAVTSGHVSPPSGPDDCSIPGRLGGQL